MKRLKETREIKAKEARRERGGRTNKKEEREGPSKEKE